MLSDQDRTNLLKQDFTNYADGLWDDFAANVINADDDSSKPYRIQISKDQVSRLPGGNMKSLKPLDYPETGDMARIRTWIMDASAAASQSCEKDAGEFRFQALLMKKLEETYDKTKLKFGCKMFAEFNAGSKYTLFPDIVLFVHRLTNTRRVFSVVVIELKNAKDNTFEFNRETASGRQYLNHDVPCSKNDKSPNIELRSFDTIVSGALKDAHDKEFMFPTLMEQRYLVSILSARSENERIVQYRHQYRFNTSSFISLDGGPFQNIDSFRQQEKIKKLASGEKEVRNDTAASASMNEDLQLQQNKDLLQRFQSQVAQLGDLKSIWQKSIEITRLAEIIMKAEGVSFEGGDTMKNKDDDDDAEKVETQLKRRPHAKKRTDDEDRG